MIGAPGQMPCWGPRHPQPFVFGTHPSHQGLDRAQQPFVIPQYLACRGDRGAVHQRHHAGPRLQGAARHDGRPLCGQPLQSRGGAARTYVQDWGRSLLAPGWCGGLLGQSPIGPAGLPPHAGSLAFTVCAPPDLMPILNCTVCSDKSAYALSWHMIAVLPIMPDSIAQLSSAADAE